MIIYKIVVLGFLYKMCVHSHRYDKPSRKDAYK